LLDGEPPSTLRSDEVIDASRDVLAKGRIRCVQIPAAAASRPSVDIGLLVVDQQRSSVRTDNWDALESDLAKRTLVDGPLFCRHNDRVGDLVKGKVLGDRTELRWVDRNDGLRQMAGPEEGVRKRKNSKRSVRDKCAWISASVSVMRSASFAATS
jgi:hypothetical protein